MLYIVGVAHRVQTKQKGTPDSEVQNEFRSYISRAIGCFEAVLVAEEFSEHALRKLSEETGAEHESITKAIAESFKVKHRFCDPDPETRARIGYVEGAELALKIAMHDTEGLSNSEVNDRGFAIEVAKYWPLRERVWLDQLSDVHDKNVFFVCGDAHVATFLEMLRQSGLSSTVVARDIGVTQSDRDFWNRVKAYLLAHPELGD